MEDPSQSLSIVPPVDADKKPFEIPDVALTEKLNFSRKSSSEGAIETKDYSQLAKKLGQTLFLNSSLSSGKPLGKKPSKTSTNVKTSSSKDKEDEISLLQAKMKNANTITQAKAIKVLTEHSEALKLIAPENIGRIRSMAKAGGTASPSPPPPKGTKVTSTPSEDPKHENGSNSAAAPAPSAPGPSAPGPSAPGPSAPAGGSTSSPSPTRASKKASSSPAGGASGGTGTTGISMKECHLSNVVRSAQRCLDHLRDVRESLSNLVAEDEMLSKGFKTADQSPEIARVAQISETITIITRDAFIPAHRLNQTAIALYNAEDFLRYPTDSRAFDIATTGRIKLPDNVFNNATLEKMRAVVDKATRFYNQFDGKGAHAHEIQDILFTIMRAMQDLYTCTLGCQEVFKILMYTNPKEKHHLQQFLLSLPSMERSDMLTEVQDLRRLVDELVIVLEKLSWGSFVVFRLATGKITVQPADDGHGGLFGKIDSNSLALYPGYPNYVKGTGPPPHPHGAAPLGTSGGRSSGSRHSPAAAGERIKSRVSINPSGTVSRAKKPDGEGSRMMAKEIQSGNKLAHSSSGEAKAASAASNGPAKKTLKKKIQSKAVINNANANPLLKKDSGSKIAAENNESTAASVWMQLAEKFAKL